MNVPDLIYLASPYTHPNASVVGNRARKVSVANAHLVRLGFCVYSPIAHCHPLSMLADLPGDYSFWEAFDKTMILACKELWVYRIPGWNESVCVQAEISYAIRTRTPVKFLNPISTCEWARITADDILSMLA